MTDDEIARILTKEADDTVEFRHKVLARMDMHEKLISEYRASIVSLSEQIATLIKDLHQNQISAAEHRAQFDKLKHDLEICGITKEEKIEHVLSGFPNKDPKGHLNFHEKLIRDAEQEAAQKAEDKKTARKRVIDIVVGGGLIFFATATWDAFKRSLH